MIGRTHRMLLVEDHKQTRELLRRMLALCGWEVVEAATLAEALSRLDPPPDCVLLDLELPDGSGEEVLRKIRADGLPTRVVVNTGIGDPSRIGEVEDLHPDRLLRKPLDADGLRTIAAMEAPAGPGTTTRVLPGAGSC